MIPRLIARLFNRAPTPAPPGIERVDRDPWWWHLPGIRLSEEAKASARWTRNNAKAYAAGCPCGRPAARVAIDYSSVGWVPIETWTCTEHVGAAGWAGTRPLYQRRDRCTGCPIPGRACMTRGSALTDYTASYCTTPD